MRKPQALDLVNNIHALDSAARAAGYTWGTLYTATVVNDLIERGLVRAEWEEHGGLFGWVFTLVGEKDVIPPTS